MEIIYKENSFQHNYNLYEWLLKLWLKWVNCNECFFFLLAFEIWSSCNLWLRHWKFWFYHLCYFLKKFWTYERSILLNINTPWSSCISSINNCDTLVVLNLDIKAFIKLLCSVLCLSNVSSYILYILNCDWPHKS